MQKGSKVIIRPKMFPLQKWEGTIDRKTPNGYRVSYEAFGIMNKTVFHPNELEEVQS